MHKDPHRNIALPDSLLSRFDLLFVVTDDVDEQRDRMISEHVLRMHRYLQPGLEEGTPAVDVMEQALSVGAAGAGGDDEAISRVAGDSLVFEKFNPLLHGGVTTTSGRGANKKKEVLSITFIKKYIQYAKTRCKPTLTKAAADYIVAVYTSLRNDDMASNQKRTSPLTARTLETLIRLSTAHAKARLSPTVNEMDAIAAEEILRFALFKEVVRAKSKRGKKNKKRKINGTRASRNGSHDSDSSDAEGSEEDTGEEEEEAAEEEAANKRMEMPTSAKKQPNGRYTMRGSTADRSTSVATGAIEDDSGVGMNTTILRSEASPAPGDAAARRATSLRASSTQPDGDAAMDEDTQELEGQTQAVAGPSSAAAAATGPMEVDPARAQMFRTRVALALRTRFADEDAISKEAFLPEINTDLPAEEMYGSREAETILADMSEKNEIYYSENIVYRV